MLTLLQLNTIGLLGWKARIASIPAQDAGLVEVAFHNRLQWKPLLGSQTPTL